MRKPHQGAFVYPPLSGARALAGTVSRMPDVYLDPEGVPPEWLPDIPRPAQPEPFDPFWVVPGSLDYRVLFQSRVWVNVHAEVLPLEEMSREYRDNVQAFLRERADHIWERIAMDLCLNAVDELGGITEAVETAMYSQPPSPLWLEETPLMRALTW